jgi:DNA-binding MarR family transcriptional regulator
MKAREQLETVTPPTEQSAVDVGESAVIHILKVADLLTRIGDSKVFGKELTQPQFNVLMVLKRHGNGGISQKYILEKLVSTKGNVSIHITNLANMGYIRRKTSKADSRMNEITLTAKGKRILADLEPKYVQHLTRITADLLPEQADLTLELLKNLQKKCEVALSNSETPEDGVNTP